MNAVTDTAAQTTPETSHQADSPGDQRAEVWMLGPVPPPVTGMTMLTLQIVRAMQAAGPVRFLSWSPGLSRHGLRSRLIRNHRVFGSVIQLLKRGPVKDQPLYLVANSQSGLLATALLVFIGRRLGYKIYLHHHVYSYIDHYDRRMAWIDRCLAGRGYHIVHDEKMIADFRGKYPSRNNFLIVQPRLAEIKIGRPRRAVAGPMRLGLLSSLSAAKGLNVAIETFESLRRAGRDVSLTLAGPAASTQAARLIDRAVANHPDHVRHLGPVYGDAKDVFFTEIDVFLFPTMTESWGLVLNEALAAGVPAITFDRGCTTSVIGPDAGLAIDPRASFVELASAQIGRWMDSPAEYERASEAAVLQSEHLDREGRRTLSEFVNIFQSNPMHCNSTKQL